MTSVVDLLRELVRIPSVNPDGDPGTAEVGEKQCAEYVASFLTKCGAETQVEDILPGRPNVVGRFPSDRPGKPRLLFAPHTDTVSVQGMTIDPFGAELREGKVWGRGASDTKGPMAAMLFALREMSDVLPRLSHEIWFAGLMGEEAGQHGSHALAARKHFDFVIVGEPTNLQTVYTHKGSVWLTLQTKGRAVHASAPEKGDNAILKMIEVLDFLRHVYGLRFGGLSDPVLGPATINIGTIRGGSKVNIVPDHCEARVDMRTLPGQDMDSFLQAIAEKFPSLEVFSKISLPLRTEPSHEMIAQLEKCGAPRSGAPWFCDAAIFAMAGSPAVALGPGSITEAHTADEWIAVSDLEAGAEFFKSFLQKLAV